MTRCCSLLALVLVVCPAMAFGAAATEPVPVAVLNFTNQVEGPAGDSWSWLEKGLADLVINDLAQHPDLQVVSREQMQVAIMRLRHEGQYVPEWQRVIAEKLRVTRAVFGTFRVNEDHAILQATVLDLDHDQSLGSVKVEGDASDVLELEKELVTQVLVIVTGEADPGAFVARLPVWTDSVPASRLLYEGVDHFDYGRYEEAWELFRRALRQVPDYADAQYWQARMYYYQLRYEHARLDFERFICEHPPHPRAGDALREALNAYVLSSGDREQIIGFCHRMLGTCDAVWVMLTPGNLIHTPVAATTYLYLCIGELRRQQRRFDDAADAFYRASLDPRAPSPAQLWNYLRLIAEAASRPPEVCHPVTIDVNHPVYEGQITASGEGRAEYRLPWFVCPEGYYIENVMLAARCRYEFSAWFYPSRHGPEAPTEVSYDVSTDTWTSTSTGTMPPMRTHTLLSVGLNFWPETPAEGTPIDYDIRFDLVPHDELTTSLHVSVIPEAVPVSLSMNQNAYRLPTDQTVQLRPGEKSLSVIPASGGWSEVYPRITRTVQLLNAGEENRVVIDLQEVMNTMRWQSVARVMFSPEEPTLFRGFSESRSETDYTADQRPVHDPRHVVPELVRHPDGRLLLCVAYFGDIWLAVSNDGGKSWGYLNRLLLPVNSAHVEASPSLLFDRSGRAVLTFLSDRNILRQFWPYVTTSDDLIVWSAPRKINEIESQTVQAIQNNLGQILVTQGTGQGVFLTCSSDGHQWSNPFHTWKYMRAKWRSGGLVGGVSKASLFQRPDETYQLVIMHHEPVKAMDPDGISYTLMTSNVLYTAQSTDLQHWNAWHRLAPQGDEWWDGESGMFLAFPAITRAPGGGVLLWGCFDQQLTTNCIYGADSETWSIRQNDVAPWAPHGMAAGYFGGGTWALVTTGYDFYERLPSFCVITSDNLDDWLLTDEWTPLPKAEPAQQWRVVHEKEEDH